MGDDGYQAVDLSFAFPFYDRSFNKAWMYDNGVVSFLQPDTADALPPWSWSSQPIGSSQYKYFIAPLWADLAPVSQTTYSLSSTSTTQGFTWNNIAEYYSAGGVLRLNTFSVELNASGAIDTTYSAVNLQTSNVSIGLKGDQDYEQIGWYPFGAQLRSLPNWSRNVNQVPTEPEVYTPPAVEDPVAVGQPEVATLPTAIVEPVAAAMAATQPAAPSPAPTAAAPQAQPQAATPVAETVASEVKVGEAKEKKTVARGSSSSTSAGDMDVVDAALVVAAGSASQSVSMDMSQASAASTIFGASSSTQYGFSVGSAMPGQLNLGSMLAGPGAVEQGAQRATGVLDRRGVFDIEAAPAVVQTEQRVERKVEQARPAPLPPSEFGPVAPAFAAYTGLVLRDVAFYAPKEIYRGQRVVDNARALRQLGNDKRHQDLVDLQYRR